MQSKRARHRDVQRLAANGIESQATDPPWCARSPRRRRPTAPRPSLADDLSAWYPASGRRAGSIRSHDRRLRAESSTPRIARPRRLAHERRHRTAAPRAPRSRPPPRSCRQSPPKIDVKHTENGEGGEAEAGGSARTVTGSCDSYCRRASRSSLTTWALPLPLSSRMTWPMRKLALLLAGLVVVGGAVLGDGVGVRGEHASTTAPSSPASLTCARPRSSTMSRGPLLLGHRLGEHVLGLTARDRAVGDEADELGEHLGREHRRREPVLVQVAEHVLAHPVGDVLRGAGFNAATARSA